MRLSITRIRGLAFIFWHARHELYHILLGLIWVWMLREKWQEFNPRWILLSVFGSVFPDIDHLWYFVTYGKQDPYTQLIKDFLKNHEWRMVTTFIEEGHKYNTDLSSHNLYFVIFLTMLTAVFYFIDWNAWVVLTGAMIIHYIFDIGDDIITLGYLNPNWKRWGNGRKHDK